MDLPEQHTSSQHRLRPRALLVLAVLTGLLGMHGLVLSGLPGSGPAAAPAQHETVHGSGGEARSAAQSVAHDDADGSGTADLGAVGPRTSAMATASGSGSDDRACHGSPGSSHGSEHADQTCASSAIPGPPVPPALTLSMGSPTAPAAQSMHPALDEPYGGRAPPSLEELQLLRV